MTHEDVPMPYVLAQKRNPKSALRDLIGFGGLAAGTAMWLSPRPVGRESYGSGQWRSSLEP